MLKSHIRMQSVNFNFIINLVPNGAIAWFLLKDKPALSACGASTAMARTS
ncbi:MAG: hypothetical protein IPF57_18035 [Gammaproteobacteria bacterium]|nr:hypothetical protein [Gammaproteobacteria bacterium]